MVNAAADVIAHVKMDRYSGPLLDLAQHGEDRGLGVVGNRKALPATQQSERLSAKKSDRRSLSPHQYSSTRADRLPNPREQAKIRRVSEGAQPKRPGAEPPRSAGPACLVIQAALQLGTRKSNKSAFKERIRHPKKRPETKRIGIP